MPTPIPRPPAAPSASTSRKPGPPPISLSMPTTLRRQLTKATSVTGLTSYKIIIAALTEHLNQLALHHAEHTLDGTWPWHHLTIVQADPTPLADGRGLRCPPECRRLPEWACCWARHDNQRAWWPTQRGEYRIRPGAWTPAGPDGAPPAVEELQLQVRDDNNRWVEYTDPDTDLRLGLGQVIDAIAPVPARAILTAAQLVPRLQAELRAVREQLLAAEAERDDLADQIGDDRFTLTARGRHHLATHHPTPDRA